MREEISAAVVFMTRLLKQNCDISTQKVEEFSTNLSAILIERFRDHWYTDKPYRGQGYRCIRINWGEPIDPVIKKAAGNSGLKQEELFRLLFPVDVTIWVDPEDVSCRFGESYGHICTLAKIKNGNFENCMHTINLDEIIEQERERHNQQVNIVTTRSSNQNNSYQFMRGIFHGKGGNFNNMQQHNYHNNRRRVDSEGSIKSYSSGEEQLNGKRESPEHVNEVREAFRQQVSQAVGINANNSNTSSPSKALPIKPEAKIASSTILRSGSEKKSTNSVPSLSSGVQPPTNSSSSSLPSSKSTTPSKVKPRK